MRATRRSFAILTFVLVAATAAAQSPASSAAGTWEGAVTLPGAELKIVVTLASKDNVWTGTIDIPAQGVRALALGAVTVQGPAVSFSIPSIPGDPSFKGAVAADGASITGTFSQGGMSAPFTLRRKTDASAAALSALAGFDDWVRSAMADWNVPGLGVAIVKDGQVVLAKGYGFRNVQAKLPVTADTLFAIGSSSKAFTTMAIAMLADEGKLDWDKPVATYLSSFALQDETAGESMTPRDLVTHRSGLPRHDLVWYNANLPREELLRRLRYLEPNKGFRETFQYQNLMYLTAGYLAGQAADSTWEDVLRTRIFEPLGMTSSIFSVSGMQKAPNFATPYTVKEKIAIDLPFRIIDTMGPAGSINSSVNDMAKWLQLQLSDGVVNGRRLVSAAQIQDMHRPHMVIRSFPGLFSDPEIQHMTYGMGWFIESYRGKKRVHHGGNIDGFSAMVSMLPDEKIGIVVLANLNGTPLPEIVARHVSDRLTGLEPIDWNGRWLKRREVGEKAGESAKKAAGDERKMGTTPAHPLDDYVGEYVHPAYGSVLITRQGAALAARFHDIPMRLNHWHYESFRADVDDKMLAEAKMFFQFFTDEHGDVHRLTVPFEPSVDPIAFKKLPPARLSDPAFLRQLAGDYVMADNPAFKISVILTASTLSLSLPGQAPYMLEPAQGTSFTLKGLSGFRARFIVEPGKPTQLKLIQPNGVFSLVKVER